MSDPLTSKFFITHSWRDNTFVRKLSEDLDAKGLRGFLDIYSVQPGDNIPAEINRGLELCDVYIPVLSSESLQSLWCEREISAALMLSAEPERNGRPRLVPVLAEDCSRLLPPLLKPLRYIVFADRYPAAFEELLSAIHHPTDQAERKVRQNGTGGALEQDRTNAKLPSDSRFAKYKVQYEQMRAKYEAGELSAEKFEEETKKFKFMDRQGRWWQIGVVSGVWYVHDGKMWNKAEP